MKIELFRGKPVYTGMFVRKDGEDATAADQALGALKTELSGLTTLLKQKTKDSEDAYRELATNFNGVKGENAEVKKTVEKIAADYADAIAQIQTINGAIEMVKKQLDTPFVTGSAKDLKDSDTKAAIELQRRIHIAKGRDALEFTPDTENLVNASHYRSAVRKLMQVGVEDKVRIIRDFTADERKAFDAASLDMGFFSPEMLGIEIDCNIICADMSDLYGQVSVSRSNFMYPQVKSYGDIGKYSCPAECDAELGPAGNIQYLQGRTYDFRGLFCFQRKVLEEANYDLLGFMMRAAQRSYTINRRNAMITGDGINEPKGWLTYDCFTKRKTSGLKFTHIDARRFITSAPMEYGETATVMHQNVFAYLAAMVDNTGRFIYGDGDMVYNPESANKRIRIANCLPDATNDNTRGNATAPFVAGDFLMANANWKSAYYQVSRRPMFMEQFVGRTTAWCVQYQFGAEDGGFVGCCAAGHTLTVGA